MFFSWLRSLTQQQRSRLSRKQKDKMRRRSAFSPRFEALEERAVFAFLTPLAAPTGLGFANGTAVADVNFDGFSDVVSVGNISGRGTVSVSLGNGDGSFQAPILSNSGNSNPLQVEVADFDGDGKQDVVTLGSYYVDSLTILKGNGDGTFGTPTPYTYSIPPTEIQVADMNGDGRPDLIEGNHFFNTTSIQLNNGTGVFSSKVDSVGVISPTQVESADFNGDGKADLVSTSTGYYSGGVTVQLGNGNGTLQAPHLYAGSGTPSGETVGDFNNDSKSDIAIANTNGTLSVLLGNGDGTFNTPTTYSVGTIPLSISQADFNGDGIMDLVERISAGFAVELGNGDGSFQASSQVTAAVGNSLIASDFNRDGVADVAIASSGSISVSINDSVALISSGTSNVKFAVATATTSVAGDNIPVTVTVVDNSGNIITDYAGTVRVFTNDPRAAGAMTLYTFTTVDAGIHTFSTGVRLFSAGNNSILVNAPFVGTTGQVVTVSPSVATHLAISTPATTVAGQAMPFSVMALDAYNNMGAKYTGTVHFTTSDSQGTVPADYTFTDADAGIHSFSGSLATVSATGQRISAIDSAIASIAGISGGVTVTPTTAASLSLIGGGGHIGSAHTVTVTARDIYGNLATGYNGVVHLSATDVALTLPADGPMFNGVGTFSVTPMTLGNQWISAAGVTDPTIRGTEAVVGTAGDATRFVVTSMPATTAGVTQSVKVTAYDAFGNIAVDYAGTVYFSSSDTQAPLPYYTFTAADAGTHTFAIVLRTAGVQTLTIRDYGNAAISFSQTGINVTAAAGSTLSVTPLVNTVAGTAQSFTVTTRDAFGNLATGYRGTVVIGSSDTIAALPANYTFTAADAGVHTFSLTLKGSGGQSVTVTDSLNPAMTFLQRDILVAAAAMTGFAFKAPSNATVGVAFSFTLSAVDAYGNAVSGYTGKVHFTGPAGIPADYTFTAADAGSHTFSVTIASTGTQSIGVQDLAKGALKGQFSITTKAASSGGGSGGGGKKV